MPVGAGLAPAGTSLAGFGTVDQAPAPILVPLPDYRTGLPDTGRFINQQTGDYEFTADGRLQGMPTVYQLVLLAIERADFSTLQERGPNYVGVVQGIIQAALSYLVTSRQVSILRIDVPPVAPDAVIAVLYWIDLTTGEAGQPVPVTP